ncbi:hypothetical protein [Roseivirga sp.]|uniref:hypothetical protein n=1 Tax=Roseivirga sp. TaxID=1964215 RepID=UPI003B8D0021
MKKKIYSSSVLMLLSMGVFAFGYSPDIWSYCMDGTAQYLKGEKAPLTGYCVIIGEREIENNTVYISKCKHEGGMFDDPTCTGNGVLQPILR